MSIKVQWKDFLETEDPPDGHVEFAKKPWQAVQTFQLRLLKIRKENAQIVAKLRRENSQPEWPDVWTEDYEDPCAAEAMQKLLTETLQEIVISAEIRGEELSKPDAIDAVLYCGTTASSKAIIQWANNSNPTVEQSL